MANRIRTGDPCGFNKQCSSAFYVGSQVWQTPEEGRRTYQPKRCWNNNKDEDNSLKTLNDKNHQASSQKFRQLTFFSLFEHSIVFGISHLWKNKNRNKERQLYFVEILCSLSNYNSMNIPFISYSEKVHCLQVHYVGQIGRTNGSEFPLLITDLII